MPLAFVVAVAVLVPPAKVPLAPVDGAANVTIVPLTGFDLLSNTVATNGAANAVLMGALCGVPPVAATMVAAPAEFVRKKFAGVVTPATVAVTVSAPDVSFAVKWVDVARPVASVTSVSVA